MSDPGAWSSDGLGAANGLARAQQPVRVTAPSAIPKLRLGTRSHGCFNAAATRLLRICSVRVVALERLGARDDAAVAQQPVEAGTPVAVVAAGVDALVVARRPGAADGDE